MIRGATAIQFPELESVRRLLESKGMHKLPDGSGFFVGTVESAEGGPGRGRHKSARNIMSEWDEGDKQVAIHKSDPKHKDAMNLVKSGRLRVASPQSKEDKNFASSGWTTFEKTGGKRRESQAFKVPGSAPVQTQRDRNKEWGPKYGASAGWGQPMKMSQEHGVKGMAWGNKKVRDKAHQLMQNGFEHQQSFKDKDGNNVHQFVHDDGRAAYLRSDGKMKIHGTGHEHVGDN